MLLIVSCICAWSVIMIARRLQEGRCKHTCASAPVVELICENLCRPASQGSCRDTQGNFSASKSIPK